MTHRSVVVTMWTGAREVARLGPDDSDPTAADLDAIAAAWLTWNDGVLPVVRVLEAMASTRRLGWR